jgi:hypothetical protein
MQRQLEMIKEGDKKRLENSFKESAKLDVREVEVQTSVQKEENSKSSQGSEKPLPHINLFSKR